MGGRGLCSTPPSRTCYGISIAVIFGVILGVCIFLPVYYMAFVDSPTDKSAVIVNGAKDAETNAAADDTNRGPSELALLTAHSDWQPRCSSGRSDEEAENLTAALNCYPELNVNEQRCRRRGCCWRSFRKKHEKNVSSMCIFPSNYGYAISGSEHQFLDGFDAPLSRLNIPSRYGSHINSIRVKVHMQTPTRLHIKFYDPNDDREQGEVTEPFIPVEKTPSFVLGTPDKRTYDVGYVKDSIPFGIYVRRSHKGNVIFNTTFPGLTFETQFRQITILLPQGKMLGTKNPRRTYFNRKLSNDEDTVTSASTHPFYMYLEEDGKVHAVLFLNSYPMEMEIDNSNAVTYRTLGGPLEFYIFFGPTPQDVSRQYMEAVGRPTMPPYWFLGLHVDSSYDQDMESVKKTLTFIEQAGYPYDVVSIGRNYQHEGTDFTIDSQKYHNLQLFGEDLRLKGRYIDIGVDPAISADNPEGLYPAMDEGRKAGVFVNYTIGNSPLIGRDKFGRVSFVDFGDPSSEQWWRRHLTKWRETLRFNSLSLEDNTPFNFVNGSVVGCPSDHFNNPPYVPYALSSGHIYRNTLCLDSWQQWGKSIHTRHYKVHNLYGHTMTKVTKKVTDSIEIKRIPLMSHSTFIGSGHYGGHWFQGYQRTWDNMALALYDILSFNVYGIPLVGSPICHTYSDLDGFLPDEDNSTDLCLRWLQMGAFYPIMKVSRDAVMCASNAGRSAVTSILTRYSLLPYLYTLFHWSHTLGDTVMRPLFYDFIQDKQAHTISEQFMWGSAIMIIPTLKKAAKDVEAYIPKGRWYDFYTGVKLESRGEWTYFTALRDRINILVRGGHIVPTQKVDKSKSTEESRQNPMHLIVALDANRKASGYLYWDDGVSRNAFEELQYVEFNFTAENNQLIVAGRRAKPILPSDITSATFTSVDILGLPQKPRDVRIKDSGVLTKDQAQWDEIKKVLKLSGILLPVSSTIQFEWSLE